MSDFDRAVEFVFKAEGYISDDAHDKGGYTVFGISERFFPEDVKKLKSLSKDDALGYAKGFYKREFWDALKLDNKPWPMNLCMFDTAVNMGVHSAWELVSDPQDWQGYLCNRVRRYLTFDQPRFIVGWINRVQSLYELAKG